MSGGYNPCKITGKKEGVDIGSSSGAETRCVWHI